nr:heterogeneous nuclear ribonucleoprotein 1-like [Tanacetum cinerariifolium]
MEEERGKVELFGSCSHGFVEMDEVDGDKFVENEFKHNKIVETHVGVDGDCEEDGKDSELKSNESSLMVVNGVENCEEDGKGHESESVGVVDDDIDLHNHGKEGIENKEGSVKECENSLETVIDKLMSKNGESLSLDKKLDACLGSHIDQLWKYEKHKESLVRKRKECDGKQEGNKENGEWVLGVHLFGKCHDLRLIGKQEWVNKSVDIDIDIRGLIVNGFLAYIRDGDDLLNQQKKREDKWPLRKKDELESYTKLLEAKRALLRREQLTSRLRSDVRRSSRGEVNYRTKKIFVGGLPATLTEEQLQQYFESYGVDGKKIVGLLGKLCEKQAQVVANDPLLMLIKGEVISDWYWNNVCELMLQEMEVASGVTVRSYELYPQVIVNGIEVLLISSIPLVFDPRGVKVFSGWDCKEGMRDYDNMGSGSLMFGDGLIGRRKRKRHAMEYAYRHQPVLKEEHDKVELFGICSRGFVEMDEVDGGKFVENEFKHNKIFKTHVGVDGDCEEDVGVVDDDMDLHYHGEEGIENKEGSVKEGENGLETVIDKLMSKNGESLSLDKKLDACLGSHIGVKLTEFSRTGVHLFGKCHDLRLIGKQEWVNKGGDIDIDIRGLNVNGFLAYIRNGDLLNQQKKREDVVQFGILEWP